MAMAIAVIFIVFLDEVTRVPMALTACVCSYAFSSSAVSLMFLQRMDEMEDASDILEIERLAVRDDRQSNAMAEILVRKMTAFRLPVKVESIPETSEISRMRDTKEDARRAKAVPLTDFTSSDIPFNSSFETETISSLEASERNRPYFLLNFPIFTISLKINSGVTMYKDYPKIVNCRHNYRIMSHFVNIPK